MASTSIGYSHARGLAVCEALASSKKSLRKTLEETGLATLNEVLYWQQSQPDFQLMYAKAKEQQLHMMAEDIVDISDDETIDPGDKRIMVDTRKWLLSKLMWRTYGDKLDVTSGGEQLKMDGAQIDARVQSIIMTARARKLAQKEGVQALLE